MLPTFLNSRIGQLGVLVFATTLSIYLWKLSIGGLINKKIRALPQTSIYLHGHQAKIVSWFWVVISIFFTIILLKLAYIFIVNPEVLNN